MNKEMADKRIPFTVATTNQLKNLVRQYGASSNEYGGKTGVHEPNYICEVDSSAGTLVFFAPDGVLALKMREELF